MTEIEPVDGADFPALFRAADSASFATKARFVGRMRADLGLLIVAAIISSASWPDAGTHGVANISSGALLFGSMALTILVKMQKDEGQWYEARALAESAKSLAWQYMSGAPPFGPEVKTEAADKLLVERLGDLVRGRKGMFKELSKFAAQGEGGAAQISDRMRIVRESSLDMRKSLYLKQRVKEQGRWYSVSSSHNGAEATKWLYVVAGAQFLAAVSALISARAVSLGAVVACISTAAAAAISWSQLNRFDELAESYGIAAYDLTMIEVMAKHISDEGTFGQFVQDSETAISREHTMWIARRGAV